MEIKDVPYDYVVKLGGEIPKFRFFDDEAKATKYATKMNDSGYYARVIDIKKLRESEAE